VEAAFGERQRGLTQPNVVKFTTQVFSALYGHLTLPGVFTPAMRF
jgi:hypothetical protein